MAMCTSKHWPRVADFFCKFARIEFALKAIGFYKLCNDHEYDAKPDWDRFATQFCQQIDGDPELAEAFRYFSERPPKKYVVRNKQLNWKEVVPNANKAKHLIDCLKRVRNNLFHGDKFNGNYSMNERDDALICHGLSVLDACLRASQELSDAFYTGECRSIR